jgi:lipoate-protein ligase A
VSARWRYLADDGVGASFGLAADEALVRGQGTGTSPPTLRLYTYASHCALVGRFQRVAAEVQLDVCRRHGIAVNRRPTGGGAILMGADQLGVAIAAPAGDLPRTYDRVRELFERFGAGIVAALATFGVRAAYRRKNDIEVEGRKIAGLGIYFDRGGGLLFHASLLVDLDIPLMLSVLRTPFEKISDKAVATVAERIATLRGLTGSGVTVAEVRERVRDAYARTLGVELEAGDLTAEERAVVARLEAERYATEAWIYQDPAVPDASGSATVKTPGGLLSVHLTLAGDVIKAVYLTGDFFSDEAAVLAVERALRWHAADPVRLRGTLEELERSGQGLGQISAEEVARAVLAAVEAARRHEHSAVARGCFVNP